MYRSVTLVLAFTILAPALAQRPDAEALPIARQRLAELGLSAEDVADLVVKDRYTSAHNGVVHTWFRQRWQGIEIWNAEVAVHQRADGTVLHFHSAALDHLSRRANATGPGIPAGTALSIVLSRDRSPVTAPALVASHPLEHRWQFDGSAFNGQPVNVQLVYQPAGERLLLAWNVNWYAPDASHWWNVRIDANTGRELERNDWVANCTFDTADPCATVAPPPAAPNDYNIYPAPLESPSHGARAIVNAPWGLAPNASPFGWHDDNGAAGAEYTITRGNNVLAQEDANGNNGSGYSPSGGASLDFDFAIDLAQAPSTYQDAAITNLFYWNNIIHDVWYQYGFDGVSGNFQSNNYGLGGVGNDHVLADAQDGSGTNNANFGTPPDGSSPRMQMFLWTAPTPDRDGDLDNGIITHEYGHGISNRLIGGPSNTSCMGNAEQMGEGWSDWFGLMMTMRPGDQRTDARGIGTYALAQPVNGGGIRPAPYSTGFSVNSYTYASTNNTSLSQPHGIGFVWCTMLWELTWDLIDAYGFDPDLYNGTGGNNIAMQLVIDGLKLTACNPGFVDGRDAILQADLATYGGAHQSLIWGAFARRGLGFSASQGSTSSRTDQVEAFNLPVNNSLGVLAALAPVPGAFFDCDNGTPVSVSIRNSGLLTQSGFTVGYRIDGGTPVTESFSGSLATNASATFTFGAPLTVTGLGTHTVKAWTALPGDQYVPDDTLTWTITYQAPASADFTEDLGSGLDVPTGWARENPDNSYTWTNVSLTNGAGCAATQAWRIEHYYYNAPGQEDRLVTPLLDLAGSAGTRLRFDHAYVRYSSAYNDGFRAEISTDCGTTWIALYQASGSALATAADNTSPWAPASCSEWAHHDIDLSAYDGKKVVIRFVAVNDFGNNFYLDNVAVVNNGVRVAMKVVLEGPYDALSGRMRDDLRSASLIPAAEPYSALGFTHAADGGGETLQSGVLNTTGDDAIVDWVLVELRSSSTPATVLATRAALVQRDGDVVDVNGTSPIALLAGSGSYQVSVRHRNHLGCMTATPLVLSTSASTMIDLASTGTATYGTNARKTIGAVAALWAGNTVTDTPVPVKLMYTGSGNDREPILSAIGGVVPTATVGGYLREDVNMDGVVKYTNTGNDREVILTNIGGVVPTNVRTEQLP